MIRKLNVLTDKNYLLNKQKCLEIDIITFMFAWITKILIRSGGFYLCFFNFRQIHSGGTLRHCTVVRYVIVVFNSFL